MNSIITARKSSSTQLRDVKSLCLSLLLFLFCGFYANAQADLSMSQTISAATGAIGDPVTITLTVTNEGTTDMNGIQVTNTLPSGISYDSDNGAGSFTSGTGVWNIGTLTTVAGNISLQITGTITEDGVLYNLAEITASDADNDSTPGNGSYFEDDISTSCVSVPIVICPTLGDIITLEAPLGLTNYQWFKDGGVTPVATTQTYDATSAGSYTFTADQNTCPAGNCCPIVIEEKCFDLALTKKLEATQAATVNAGDDVVFTIEVTNQGQLDAYDIEITDYIPTGMTLSAANGVTWTSVDATTATTVIDGPIIPNGTASVNVILTVDANFMGTTLDNYAEISFAAEEDGSITAGRDIDSPMDNNRTNDTGGTVGDPNEDDYILGNGTPGATTIDEDNHDPERVNVNQTYDLALRKTLAGGQTTSVTAGDDVNFLIEIINQGTLDAASISIVDYVDQTMFEDFTITKNANGTTTGNAALAFTWTESGGNGDGMVSLAGTLPAGQTVFIPVTLTVKAGAPATISNYAEIVNDDGDDVDSTPESETVTPNRNGDKTVDDVVNDEPVAGNDEDDLDIASLTVCARITDLAVSAAAVCEPETVDLTVTHDAGSGDLALYYAASSTVTAAQLYDFANHANYDGAGNAITAINATLIPVDATATTTTETGATLPVGTYTVYAILAQGNSFISDPACLPVQQVNVTVDPKPVLATTPATICAGETVDLSTLVSDTNTATDGAGTYTYHTSQANADANIDDIGASQTPDPNTTPITYFIRKTTTAGCFDTESVVITIAPNPDLTPSNLSICKDSTVDLNDQVTDNNATAGTTTFYLTQAAADAGTPGTEIADPVNYVASADATIYVRKVTDANSCVSTTSFTITTTEITTDTPVATCNDNTTPSATQDDYFTVAVTASNANAGISGKYEILLASDNTVLTPVGGVDYGAVATIGQGKEFSADGTTTYDVIIRDLDTNTCQITVTLAAVDPCFSCPPEPICLPVTFERKPGTN